LFSLCRLLMRKRKVLILDEATANVDQKTDRKMQDLIRSEFSECTVLTIAHRLDTIMNSDRVIVMEKGEIAEIGIPQELIAKGGMFAELVKANALHVHWAFINKVRANTLASDPAQCFAEWKKLLSWEVASKAPHVFYEATSQMAQLATSGRIDVVQSALALADLVVVPPAFADSVSSAEVVSAVSQALVHLLVAGADLLIHSPEASSRDNILRSVLERNPLAWGSVLQFVRSCILPGNVAGVDGEAQEFEATWIRVSRFLRYAAIDPTVPAEAQSQALHALFDAMREWASTDSQIGRRNALLMLDWAVGMSTDAVEPLAPVSGASSAIYYTVDTKGRWTRHRVLAACVEVVLIIYRALSRLGPREDSPNAEALRVTVDQMRLILGSLVCYELHDASTLPNHCSANFGYEMGRAAALIAKLMPVAHALTSAPVDIHVDAVVWSLAVSQLTRAVTRAEQGGFLDVIEIVLRTRTLVAALPAPVVALARFPLMCVATDGFDKSMCSRALRLCEDIDQLALTGVQESADATSSLQCALVNIVASQWVSGRLIVHISALRDYLSLYLSLYSAPGAGGSTRGPLERAFRHIEPVASQPVLVAPLLFEWNLLADTRDSNRATLPLIALAHLLRLVPSVAGLRLNLLPLFVCALKHPDCPPKLKLALVLQAIPCLASTQDAYTTSRVVSVVSGLWTHANSSLPGASASVRLGRRRMRCLAIRAWGNVVISNPRVWRDLKPLILQFVETTKSLQGKACDLDYEWAVLVTMRDLVRRAPDRYADQMLPLVYSLLNFALDFLSASSASLLVDIACACVESDMAGVRSVWTTIVSKPAMHWLSHSNRAGDAATSVLESLARFFKLVATHGEASDTYAAFRQQILGGFVGPMCANVMAGTADPSPILQSSIADGMFNATYPRTRDCFLSALAAYPSEELLALLSTGTPSQAVHQLLAQQSQQQSSVEVADRLARAGGASDLLAVFMDNEVRFMRRSLLSGGSATLRTADKVEGELEEPDLPAQRQSWAASNLERSQWLNEILQPVLENVGARYWDSSKLGTELLAGFALTTMASSLATTSLVSCVDDALQRLSTRLKLLIADASLADHWCLRNCASDVWQIWFTKALKDVQTSGVGGSTSGVAISASEAVAAATLAGHQLASDLRETLRTSYIPARMANALYALAGLVKAAASVDQNLGSELSMVAGSTISDLQLLPFKTQSPDEFWLQAAGSLNDEVLAAAIECAGQISLSNSHDQAALSQTSQFLMAGLMLSVGGGGIALPAVAVQAIARSLASLHTVLFAQRAADAQAFSEDIVVVEADGIRRCVERLDILAAESTDPKRDASVVDLGSVGLATALAAMHRQWISRLLNPAMAEQNTMPRAVQALREVARTLSVAYDNLKWAEDGRQINSRSVASLYYLCFVWPPRPISQRHIELHSSLFVVTPDRVWQAATRLVRKLWLPTDSKTGELGKRQLDYINCVELAVATLAYHLAMTASQGVAPSAHLKLVKQYSDWVRGDTGGVQLAANEKPSVRTSRAVALAILLGVPLHGIPETTVSNEYLPASQQRLLPALLGVGSVQHGSTAWLRMPESVLQSSLGVLLACSGLARHLKGDDDAAANVTEIGDVRLARVSGFVVGGLLAQSSRAAHLLLLEQRESQSDRAVTAVAPEAKSNCAAATSSDSTQQTKEANTEPTAAAAAETTVAASEEPKHLGRLPAPSSWCRAVWENISELSEALVREDGSVAESVECKLVCLLSAMFKASRPFPVVDSRKVFGRLLSVYLDLADAANFRTKRLPLLALLLRTADKLSPVSYSMAQFVAEATQHVVRKVVDISCDLSTDASQYVDDKDKDTFVDLALGCLGGTGLGRILRLSGFASSSGATADVGATDAGERSALILGSTALYAKVSLAAAIAGTAPQMPKPKAVLVESDAARMFRVMSKVAMPSPKTAN
ncbi:Transporter of the ATP-binding cassette (ABC), partial [Coemansia sp. BCRC 34301]